MEGVSGTGACGTEQGLRDGVGPAHTVAVPKSDRRWRLDQGWECCWCWSHAAAWLASWQCCACVTRSCFVLPVQGKKGFRQGCEPCSTSFLLKKPQDRAFSQTKAVEHAVTSACRDQGAPPALAVHLSTAPIPPSPCERWVMLLQGCCWHPHWAAGCGLREKLLEGLSLCIPWCVPQQGQSFWGSLWSPGTGGVLSSAGNNNYMLMTCNANLYCY